MAKSTDYIPSGNLEFFNFQDDLVESIDTNKVAWGILPAKVTALQGFQTPYVTAYNKIKNKNTRTPAQVTTHKQRRKTFEKEIRKFVNEFLAFNSAVTNEQRTEMGLNIRDTTATERSAITTSPVVSMTAGSGARIVLECRVASDSTKASIHPEADEAEVKFEVGITAPAAPENCTQTTTSKKAKFTIQLSVSDAGKKIFLFTRWKNASNNSKSGPWGLLMSTTITN